MIYGRSVLLLSVVSALAGATAAHAYTHEVVRCRESVNRSASAHARLMIDIVSDCHAERFSGGVPAATDCNDVAAAAAALGVPFTDTVYGGDANGPGGRCEGIAPAEAAYTSCPAPCAAITIDGWSAVDECLACVTKSRVESFGTNALGSPALPLGATESGCMRALVDLGARVIPTILKDSERCEKDVDRPNVCNEKIYHQGKLPKIRAKVSAAVTTKCEGANFAALAGCATGLSDSGCVLEAATRTGEQLAYDATRLQELLVPMSSSDFTSIALAHGGLCGLRADGTLDCWGEDGGVEDYGRFGRFSAISSNGGTLCGIRADGSVDCFFDSGYVYSSPGTPPAGTFTAISIGSAHACALDSSGSAVCWGYEYYHPTIPTGTFTQIASGGYHDCGLRASGAVECWGDSFAGETTPPPGTFTQLSLGYGHSCGLHQDGTIECWGYQEPDHEAPPAGVFLSLADHVGGYYDNCAIRADSTIACWGHPTEGDAPPAGAFSSIFSDGNGEFCALRADASVACWGRDGAQFPASPEGGLVRVSSTNSYYGHYWCDLRSDGAAACRGDDVSGSLDPPPGPFLQLSAGDRFACALRPDATIVCWGNSEWGQTVAPSGTFLEVSTGESHVCALRSDHSVQCWGNSGYDKVNAPPGSYSQVSAGFDQSCATTTSGGVKCWGYTYAGSAPPAGTDGFMTISAGEGACGIKNDGEVQCWGERGQAGTFREVSNLCGLRTTGSIDCWYPRWVPAGVYTGLDDGGLCALRRDGYKVCWR